MEAVKATVDAAHWLSAVEDLTVRSGAKEREHTVLLRIDAGRQTLSLLEEDADSAYRITLPIDTETEATAQVLTCKLTARKLAPVGELFAHLKDGRVTITVRKNTLSFKRGDQHLLLPNLLVKKTFAEKGSLFAAAKPSADGASAVRFIIPDHQPLCRALELCTDTALRVRVGGGVGGNITVHDQAYPVDSRTSGLHLWPRVALFNRLSQLPGRCKLHVALTGQAAVHFSTGDLTAKTGVQREFVIKPYPMTNLYIAANKSASKHDDNAPWKSTHLKNAPDKKRSKRSTLLSDGSEDDFAELHLNPRSKAEKVKNETHAAPSDLANQTPVIPPSLIEPTHAPKLPPQPPGPSALEELEQLPGLTHVKKQIRDIAQFAAFENERLHALGITSTLR